MKLRYLAVAALAAVSTFAQAQSKPRKIWSACARAATGTPFTQCHGALDAMAKGDVPSVQQGSSY